MSVEIGCVEVVVSIMGGAVGYAAAGYVIGLIRIRKPK